MAEFRIPPQRSDRLLANVLESGLAAKDLTMRAYLLRQSYGACGAVIQLALDLRELLRFDVDVIHATPSIEISGRDDTLLRCAMRTVKATRSSLFYELEVSTAYRIGGKPDLRREYPPVKGARFDFDLSPSRAIFVPNRSFEAQAGDLRRLSPVR